MNSQVTSAARGAEDAPAPRGNPTSKDVAREAGVSQATVSLVVTGKADGRISPVTQESVLRAALRLGYRPNAAARTLRLGHPHTVALAVPTVANPYFASVLLGAEHAARDKGYAVVLVDMGEDQDWRHWLADTLTVRGLDGCILYAADTLEPSQVRRLGRNVVLIESVAPNASSVLLDIETGAAAAMAHLIELGHRRIAHLVADYARDTFRLRQVAYRRALQEAGGRFRTAYVARASFDIDASTAAVRDLLDQRQRPTAVVCDDDLLAAGAYKAAHALGMRIPDDLSVVGFDDISLARMLEPELTTVAIPAEDVGASAMTSFLSLVNGGRPQTSHISLTLAVRGSTAPPPPESA